MFCPACWTLAVTFPEIVLPMPLLATVESVGGFDEPPVAPLWPLNWASVVATELAGAGAGDDGAAPGPEIDTEKLGRVIVCDGQLPVPQLPVTVSPLP